MGIITHAELINKTTGTKEVLFKRQGSYCNFSKEFRHGRFFITLRLDWRDTDPQYHEPRLDADIFTIDEKSGKKKKYKKNKKDWHNTNIQEDSETLAYYFAFEDLELVLTRRYTVESGLDGKIVIKKS